MLITKPSCIFTSHPRSTLHFRSLEGLHYGLRISGNRSNGMAVEAAFGRILFFFFTSSVSASTIASMLFSSLSSFSLFRFYHSVSEQWTFRLISTKWWSEVFGPKYFALKIRTLELSFPPRPSQTFGRDASAARVMRPVSCRVPPLATLAWERPFVYLASYSCHN